MPTQSKSSSEGRSRTDDRGISAPRRWARYDLPAVVNGYREQLSARLTRAEGRFDLPVVTGRTSKQVARRLA